MATLQELIHGLPVQLRPNAERYLTIIDEASDDYIRQIVDFVVLANWPQAFRMITVKMNIVELLSELERINEELYVLNNEYYTLKQVQIGLVREFLITALSMLKAKVITP